MAKMAEIPTLEAAPPEGVPEALPAAPSAKKKWLIIGAAVLVLLAGTGAGAWYFLGSSAEDEEQATAETGADSKTKGKAAAKGKANAKGKAKEKLEPLPEGPPLFVALDPPFVVNFEAASMVRFLQITAQVMSRDAETIELLKANDPIVRNDLLLLFANQKYEVIATREGKEALRQQALESVRHVIKGAGGKPHFVEAVYFTSFVMQ